MKRWIHASEDYTDMISEELPESVQEFISTPDDSIDYTLVTNAVNDFFEEYKRFPSGMSMDSLNIKYDEDKRRFYRKYRDFADKCKLMYKNIKRPSGYGKNDYVKIKMIDRLKSVDYNFPYGWKYC